MKPYKPYAEEAFLIENEPGSYSISFRGINYLASNDLTALGALLFGLRPCGFNFRCQRDPSVPMHQMHQTAHILHLHANGDRNFPDGSRRISEVDLTKWVESATGLAPTAHAADFVRGCVDAALGPYAHLSDEDFLLSNQDRK
jgi:hypothetical protein